MLKAEGLLSTTARRRHGRTWRWEVGRSYTIPKPPLRWCPLPSDLIATTIRAVKPTNPVGCGAARLEAVCATARAEGCGPTTAPRASPRCPAWSSGMSEIPMPPLEYRRGCLPEGSERSPACLHVLQPRHRHRSVAYFGTRVTVARLPLHRQAIAHHPAPRRAPRHP